MSDKLDAQISMTADATGVEAGVGRAKRSLRSLADSAKQVGADVGSMGDGSERAAKKVERDTKSMERSLQNLLAKLEGGSRESRQYWEKLADLKGIDKNSLRPLLSQLDEYALKQRHAADVTNGFVSSLGGLQRALVSTGVAAAAAKFISVADSVTTLENQLKLATGSIDSAASSYAALFDIAQRSRVGFVELGDTFASIARAAAPLGVTQERLLNVTEAIGNAMTISGGSAQGLQAALVQLGQGLSSGTLRGEELNSVMEQAPRLAKALADGLGVTTGQLRAMGAEGEITAEKVINALESQSAVLRGEVAGATLTVGQAFTQLGNSATYAVGELDKTIGASEAAARAVSGIASAIDVVGKAAVEHEAALKAVFGGAAVLVGAKAATVAIGGVTAAITAARVATVGFTAALAANPVGAALVTITALGVAAYSSGLSLGDLGSATDLLGRRAEAAAKELEQVAQNIKDAESAAANAAVKLAEAEAALADLEQRGAKKSSNLFLREAYADAQRLVDKLKEAKREKDSLSESAKSMRVDGDPYNDGTQYGEWKAIEKARADAAQAFADLQAKKIGITKQYLAEEKIWADAFNNGLLGEGEEAVNRYAAAVADLDKRRRESSEAGRAEAKALKAGAGEAKAAENSYQGLLKAVNEHMAAVKLQMDGSAKLTESQKLQIKYDELLARGKQGASAATIALVQAQIAALAVLEKEQKAIKLNVAGYQEYLALQDELADEYVKQSKAKENLRLASDRADLELQDQIARIELEAQMLGRTAEARQIAVAQLDAEIERRKELEVLAKNLDLDESVREEERIRINERYAKKVALAQRKAYVSEWDKTSQLIGDTLADYIMGGGKDAATYLKRLFSTLVLQPVVQYGVQNLLGAIGMGGGSAGGSNVMGALNNLSNLNTMYSAFSGSLTNSVGTAFSKAGQLFGSEALKSFGAGTQGAYLPAGVQGPVTGGSGAGIGASGVAAVAAVVAGMIASNKLFAQGYSANNFSSQQKTWDFGTYYQTKIASNIFGEKWANILSGAPLGNFIWNKFGATPHAGAASEYRNGVASGNATTAQNLVNAGDSYIKSMQGTVDSLATSVGSTLDALATAFGKQSGYYVGTGFTSDGKDPSSGFFQLTTPDGTNIDRWKISRKDPKYTSRGKTGYSKNASKGYDEYLKDVAEASLKGVVGLVPDWADDMVASVQSSLGSLSGADAMKAFQSVVQQIALVDAAFDSLGEQMAMFKDLSDSVQTTLIRAFGGFEGLSSTAASFYDNFYSEQEKLDAVVSDLTATFGKYGAELPTTAEQYRKLVEQQFAAGDAGAEFAAVLLGLNGTFKSVADAWKQELGGMASTVSGFFGDLQSAIDSLSADIAADRKAILRGNDVMSAADIAAGIAGSVLLTPSTVGIASAGAISDAAREKALQQKSSVDAANALAAAQAEKLNATKKARDEVVGQIGAVDAQIASLSTSGGSLFSRLRKKAALASNEALRAQLKESLVPLAEAVEQQQAAYDGLAAVAKDAVDRLAEAQKALTDAQNAEVQAKVDYAKEMSKFVADAAGSVDKLSDLRGEVVSFYEAQVQAVQGMLQSAGKLRSVVDNVRLGQLDSTQTAAELGNRYATDYAMALATTGSTRAGYVDSMAGNLQGLSEALKAEAVTGAEWRIQTAKLFAQASNAAGLLEGDAEADDYQDVALGLLDSIDTALESLSAATVSAEQVIADAINAGTAAQLDGLRAIVAALKGDPIPAFATGGYHTGGLRWVGENGPELEATGPSRIWNQSQLASALGGGGNSEVLVAEIRALREEQRAQAATIVRLQQDNNRLLMRWETQGLPTERDEV